MVKHIHIHDSSCSGRSDLALESGLCAVWWGAMPKNIIKSWLWIRGKLVGPWPSNGRGPWLHPANAWLFKTPHPKSLYSGVGSSTALCYWILAAWQQPLRCWVKHPNCWLHNPKNDANKYVTCWLVGLPSVLGSCPATSILVAYLHPLHVS